MRAKLINENLNDLFKPKSKEEINKILELNPTHRNYIFISKINKFNEPKTNEENRNSLYPMKNNSSISYPTIGYYEYPLINGKLSSDKINEIIYEMGVVFEQEECWDYDIQKMEFRRLFELN